MDHSCARAFAKFITLRYKDAGALKHLRLGQHFCNLFIKSPWPELYNEEDLARSTSLITQWLEDNQYYDELPPILNGDSK
jgi:hypothetical protein